MVWSLGPLTKIVQECGFLTPSTKVYFSSPKTCSYTSSAYPLWNKKYNFIVLI